MLENLRIKIYYVSCCLAFLIKYYPKQVSIQNRISRKNADKHSENRIGSVLFKESLEHLKNLLLGMIIKDILFSQLQALLGQKYGYRPFPPNIVATEFEDLFTGAVPFYYHIINQDTSCILLVLLITHDCSLNYILQTFS